MRTYQDVSKEIILLEDVLKISEQDLADSLGVSLETIHNWKNNLKQIEDSNVDKLYGFANRKGIMVNKLYEQLLKEEHETVNSVVLFHGAKKDLSLPVDFHRHSKSNNDFGKGFYLGESFEQASAYIANSGNNRVYSFKLNFSDLKTTRMNVNNDWMLAVAYYRGWLEDYSDSPVLQEIISGVQTADLIIAPIADNRMFDIIQEFAEGEITDLQCEHALAATDLGNQYVVRTDKAVRSLELLREMFVSSDEKKQYIENNISLTKTGLSKVRLTRIEYRGKGKYIEELLK